MESSRERTITLLKELIDACKVSERLLHSAANAMHDELQKREFLLYAEENSNYIRKLKSEILRLGGAMDEEADLVKVGMQLNEAGLGIDAYDLLKQCQNGMNKALVNYHQVTMKEDVLWEIIPVISKQYFKMKESYNKIKDINVAVPA